MGQVTPNISIYIPSAGETNYDQPFASGMNNIDQHDHSGGPTKGVPIATSGIADGSITAIKLNPNVVDPGEGLAVSGGNPNALQAAGLLNSVYKLAANGLITKTGATSAASRTITPTANQTTVSNGDGVAGNPVVGLTSTIYTNISFDSGANTLQNYIASTTWTPVLTFGGASVGITYATQLGKYMRIGNIIFYKFEITLTSKGASTGVAQVTGLPTAAAADSINATGVLSGTMVNTATATQFYSEVPASASSVTLSNTGAGQDTQLTDVEFANNSAFSAQGFYFV